MLPVEGVRDINVTGANQPKIGRMLHEYLTGFEIIKQLFDVNVIWQTGKQSSRLVTAAEFLGLLGNVPLDHCDLFVIHQPLALRFHALLSRPDRVRKNGRRV